MNNIIRFDDVRKVKAVDIINCLLCTGSAAVIMIQIFKWLMYM